MNRVLSRVIPVMTVHPLFVLVHPLSIFRLPARIDLSRLIGSSLKPIDRSDADRTVAHPSMTLLPRMTCPAYSVESGGPPSSVLSPLSHFFNIIDHRL